MEKGGRKGVCSRMGTSGEAGVGVLSYPIPVAVRACGSAGIGVWVG